VDKRLKYKLRRELTAILNWAVEGYLLWRSTGLQEPECIKEQRKDYRTEMDSIEAFIEECCIRNSNATVQAKSIYQSYREWASENGQYMMNSTKFGREMSKKFEKVKKGVVSYKGISLYNDSSSNVYRMSY
jgi:putative DNA primase/helicase